ncbi:MAG: 5-amino-6-(D-ribitylamino)uracil--L-tyrosine 4-hydroxyphenyl transferase CofH [Emcibacter sp.]|nr:5-amino-6-(D-ribitylamino)uracil--L-tyrosine 4-hydroxyphenyl transferase CofH [Emcibacter sp.]
MNRISSRSDYQLAQNTPVSSGYDGMIDMNAFYKNAASLRDQGHGRVMTYSPKVFIPLTHLCRDVCHYCTFAESPKKGEQVYMTPVQILDIVRAGAQKGCKEVLFTLGDKPELRYKAVRNALKEMGYETTIDYLEAMCRLVLKETGLLPHVNPGVISHEELDRLRTVSVSQGLMLESTSARLCEKGGPHYGSPDKNPEVRLHMLEMAGKSQIPYTTGILIGIGETREERIETLKAILDSHNRHGHIQEVIIQAFQPKAKTRMANHDAPTMADLKWTIAMARHIFGPDMNIQAPPNLSSDLFPELVTAGINDWGGVSPLTPDFVNPEAPWPEIENLRQGSAKWGKILIPRLALYPSYVQKLERWTDPLLRPHIRKLVDSQGYARESDWVSGLPSSGDNELDILLHPRVTVSPTIQSILNRALAGNTLNEDDIILLFQARDGDAAAVMEASDQLRAKTVGDEVTYVINRNINYTNVCTYKCQFCAFSKGRGSESLRGPAYDLPLEEIVRRTVEARSRGASEVCLQGGIHPDYSGKTYLAILKAIKKADPKMHVHAFSPLEIFTGAKSLNISVHDFLLELKEAGLGSLPGTAAEILVDEVRQAICANKITVDEWLNVMETAHNIGLPTTATIMFGHLEEYKDWASHLLKIKSLQIKTGGFTEFVPLPFVPHEAPMFKQGKSRRGPTLRETILMHSVARLVLHPHIINIQASWTKMGPQAIEVALKAGVNDLGGTLMNESISRAAGSEYGQEKSRQDLISMARAVGRPARQRSTIYGNVVSSILSNLPPLDPLVEPKAGKRSNIIVR